MEDQDATRLAQEEETTRVTQEGDTQQPQTPPAGPEAEQVGEEKATTEGMPEEPAAEQATAPDAEDIAEEIATTEGMPEEPTSEQAAATEAEEDTSALRATLEAIVYITDEPLTLQQISAAIAQPIDKVKRLLDDLVAEYDKPEHGLSIREIAGGYKMATKAEHHESVRAFVKKLTPPLKLSLAALETLAVIAYKQPVTAPEIMDIRGVQGAGVLKTLLDRKLIQEGGRKKVIGQPILYKTTKEFLVQFGLNGLAELPTLKEFEELGRMELVEEVAEAAEAATDAAMTESATESQQETQQEESQAASNDSLTTEAESAQEKSKSDQSAEVSSDTSQTETDSESTQEQAKDDQSIEIAATDPQTGEAESADPQNEEEKTEEKAAENA